MRWLPYFVITTPIIVYFLPLFLFNWGPIDFGHDTALYFYPLTVIGMEQWRNGHLPLWTPLVQNGFPLLADGQGAILYPLNIFSFFLFPEPYASVLPLLINTLIGSVGMYVLSRELKLPVLPSVLASLIWVAVGVFPTQSLPQLNAVAWWPLLVLLAVQLAAGNNRFSRVPAIALITGFMWLGGFPQMAAYGIILASFFFLYALLFIPSFKHPWTLMFSKSNVFAVTYWLLGLAAGVGIAAIQLIPTLEMTQSSVRAGGLDYTLAAQGSLFPSGLIGYFNPGWNVEGYLSAGVYFGIIALLLAMMGVRQKAGSLEKFLLLLVVVALLLSFGKYTPLYPLISRLPGLSFLRVPLRFTMLAAFAFSLLAGIGLKQLVESLAEPARAEQFLRSFDRRLKSLFVVMISATVIGGVLIGIGEKYIVSLASQFVQKTLLSTRYHMYDWEYYEAKINAILQQVAHSLSPANPRTIQPVIIALLVLLLIWFWRKSGSIRKPALSPFLPILIVLITFFDLSLIVGNPMGRIPRPRLLEESQQIREIIRASGGDTVTPNRIFKFVTESDLIGGANSLNDLPPNLNMLFGIPHTGVYSALGSVRYFDLLGSLGGVNLAYGFPPSSVENLRQDFRILSLLGARYVTAGQQIVDDRLEILKAEPPYLYRNNDVLPRVFFVSEAVEISSGEAIQTVRSPEFDPHRQVALEKETGTVFPGANRPGQARIIEEKDDYLTIETVGNGWLVLTDLYYPGWKAQVDGVETEIFRADAVFRAIAITQSERHLVTFSYEPDSFKYGLMVSGISSLFVMLMIAGAYILSKRAPNEKIA